MNGLSNERLVKSAESSPSNGVQKAPASDIHILDFAFKVWRMHNAYATDLQAQRVRNTVSTTGFGHATLGISGSTQRIEISSDTGSIGEEGGTLRGLGILRASVRKSFVEYVSHDLKDECATAIQHWWRQIGAVKSNPQCFENLPMHAHVVSDTASPKCLPELQRFLI